MVCSISSARTTKSRCREVSRRQTKDMLRVALLCAMALFLTGCLDRMAEEVEEPGMYMPGSRVTSTPGKRYVIRGAEVTSASVAKWRVRSESTKIYGADHVPLARLKVRETAQGSEIVATSLDGSREVIAKLSKKTPDRIPVGKLFNLERREGRWLVTDRQELILGVITDISPEKKKDIIFEVRDSYALQAPATMRAERIGGESRLLRLSEASGKEEVELRVNGALSPAVLIAYAFEHEGLDPMTRAVLARALEHALRAKPATPDS